MNIKCGQFGCPAHVQGEITITCAPSGGKVLYSFSGTCVQGHKVGRGFSRELQEQAKERGWRPPAVGKSNTFKLPKTRQQPTHHLEIDVPLDARYVIVDVRTLKATCTNDADLQTLAG